MVGCVDVFVDRFARLVDLNKNGLAFLWRHFVDGAHIVFNQYPQSS